MQIATMKSIERCAESSDSFGPFPFTIGDLRVLGHGLPTISRVRTNYCAAASFRGSLTASKVANSMAQGSPFTFSTLRI